MADACEIARRLRASLQRAQRLTQGFTDGLLSLFTDRAGALGTALGIQPERIQVRPALQALRPCACAIAKDN